MKTLLLLTTILAGTVFVSSALAATDNATTTLNSAPTPAARAALEQSPQQWQTAATILGDINIANVALTYGMKDDALSHINAARQALTQFNGGQAYQPSIPMTAGRLNYKNTNGNESTYWIPVVNDHFVVRTLQGKHLASKNPDIDVTDAQIVHYKLILNTKIADDQLAQAQAAISQNRLDVAINALQGISRGAVSEAMIQDRPMEAARDNLILSRELLDNQDYRGASYALKHASSELKQVEKDNPHGADNTAIGRMQSQIDGLQATIAREKPSDLKIAEMKIEGWIKDVKDKIHSQNS